MAIFQVQENYDIADRYGVAATWDSDAQAVRKVPKRNVWQVQDQWGNGDKIDSTVQGERMRFHPGRDIQWDVSRCMNQIVNLDNAGVFTVSSMFDGARPNPSGLFKGAQGIDDFANLIDACHGKQSKDILDIAPDLWIAQELIHQTGEIETEDRVELTARRLLPWKVYNTWMDYYRFDRIEHRGSGFSQPVNISGMTGIPTPKKSRKRKSVQRPLYHHFSGAEWNVIELEIMAEARANGAPDYNLVSEDTQDAQDDISRTENALAYFGGFGIKGLLDPENEIAHIPAAQQLGDGANPVDDRNLFVDTACTIIEGSVTIQRADTILVGTRAWCYLNKTLFSDQSNSNSRTLLSMVLEGLAPLGINRIEWAPEMEFRQAQATQLINEHGFPTALANRWSGGVGTENVMAFINTSPAAGTVAVGKATAARPQERIRDDIEARYVASSGGYDSRKPAASRILTDVGPVP